MNTNEYVGMTGEAFNVYTFLMILLLFIAVTFFTFSILKNMNRRIKERKKVRKQKKKLHKDHDKESHHPHKKSSLYQTEFDRYYAEITEGEKQKIRDKSRDDWRREREKNRM